MHWRDEYERRRTTADEAVKVVKSGDRVFVGQLPRDPLALGFALARRRDELRGVTIFSKAAFTPWPWLEPGWEESFRQRTRFIWPASRPAIQAHRADFVPCNLSTPGKQSEAGRGGFDIDVAFLMVSPPDADGYCSFGQAMWYSQTMVQHARHVVAEVHEEFIRTGGDNRVHVSRIDAFVPDDTPPLPGLIDALNPAPGEEEAIAVVCAQVAELIHDGDTLMLGAGSVSGALPAFLGHKHDLGVHSEMVSPGLVDLVREGVITGRRRTLFPGTLTATHYGGAAAQLAFMDGDPRFGLYDVTVNNDPKLIARNDNLVAVNTLLQIDLTGQVCSESIGPAMYTGTGGQLEFVVGALLSRGGRSVHVMQSTSGGGRYSRVVPQLGPGTVVTVPRQFVDYVVSEYGVASLQDKTERERAAALIAIAHPDFRPELQRAARALFG